MEVDLDPMYRTNGNDKRELKIRKRLSTRTKRVSSLLTENRTSNLKERMTESESHYRICTTEEGVRRHHRSLDGKIRRLISHRGCVILFGVSCFLFIIINVDRRKSMDNTWEKIDM